MGNRMEVQSMRIGKSRGSYLPVLTTLVAQTTGPILELGCGFCSTPYLHWACFPSRRRLVTYENSPQWCDFAESWRDKFHDIHCVTDWDTADLSEPWTIAFVDHTPHHRRELEIRRLVHAEYVVVHDTENNNDSKYHISRVHPLYKYRWKYNKAYPYTSVFSNYHPLDELKRVIENASLDHHAIPE